MDRRNNQPSDTTINRQGDQRVRNGDPTHHTVLQRDHPMKLPQEISCVKQVEKHIEQPEKLIHLSKRLKISCLDKWVHFTTGQK